MPFASCERTPLDLRFFELQLSTSLCTQSSLALYLVFTLPS